jgi:hypothetical protein
MAATLTLHSRLKSSPFFGAVFLSFVTDGLLSLEGYVRDQFMNAGSISGEAAHARGGAAG